VVADCFSWPIGYFSFFQRQMLSSDTTMWMPGNAPYSGKKKGDCVTWPKLVMNSSRETS
jgi:hypothetical protein